MSYDGRISEKCKQECQDSTCTKTWGDPYGCGGCCRCRGGCVEGYMEQQDEHVKADEFQSGTGEGRSSE